MITYTTVALLMSLVLEIDGTRAIRERIREGSIATDLMKPISLPLYFFSDGLGQTVLGVLLIVPSLLFALLLVHVDVPGAGALGLFVVSFALGYGVNFFLNFLMNSVAFWTLETFALQLMVRWISDLLSGQVIPLSLFPGPLGRAINDLPFAAIYSTPLRIYIGQLSGAEVMPALAAQALWLAAFTGLGIVVWRRAQRRVVVQGG
jgi:ABC-type uncharacterized transport system permease subunit